MKSAYRLLAVSAICFTFFAIGNEANAQRGGRRVPHFSRTQTVSPYINLFQSRNGGVTNYLTEVRPQLQFQRQLNNLQNSNRRGSRYQTGLINRQTMMLQDTIERTLQMSLRQGRQSEPVTAGRFMNTGHFFPSGGISLR